MAHFVFFCSSIATPVPLPLLYSTCLTSLFNIFWAIQQELFFMSIPKKNLKSLAYSIQIYAVEPTISVFLEII